MRRISTLSATEAAGDHLAIAQARDRRPDAQGSAQLERLRAFVASHGTPAWIENGTVLFETQIVHRDGRIEVVTDRAETLSKARELLGY